MRNLILVLLLVSIIAFVGCISVSPKAATYTIEVSGTNGLKFFGNYGGLTLEGEKVSQSVEGEVPVTYTVRGTTDTIVYCSFRKRVEAGTLNVQIFKDGELATQAGTAEPFGTVTLLTN